MLIPLWLPDNETQDSSVFKVLAGHTALLIATGFERFRVNTDAKEFRSPQLACLHQVIFDYDQVGVGALEPRTVCDCVYEFTRTVVNITDVLMQRNGCALSLGSCTSFALLSLPGSYYFHLNDETAVGTAQVWVDFHKNENLPQSLLTGYVL